MMMLKRTIKTKLTVAFIGLVLATAIGGGVTGFLIIWDKVYENYEQSLRFQASHFAEDLHHFIDMKKELLLKISDTREFTNFTQYHRDMPLVQVFSEYKDSFPALIYVDKDGYEEVKVSQGKVSDDYVHHDKESNIMKSVSSPNKIAVTSLLESREIDEKVIYMTIKKHSYFGNEFLGTLIGQIPASTISASLKHIVALNQGFLSLIDDDGIVLAQSDGLKLGEKISDSEAIAVLASQKLGYARVPVLEVDTVSASMPVNDTNWHLVISVPYSHIKHSLNQLILIFSLLAIAILVIALIVSLRLAKSIGSPISVIAAAARKVADGNLSVRSGIQTDDEMGELSRTFDTMIENLSQVQEVLVAEKNYTENIIRTMMNCLFVMNEKMIIIDANEAVTTLLGYSHEELRGCLYSTILKAEDFDDMMEKMQIETNLSNLQYTFIKKDGEEVPVLASFSVMKDNSTGTKRMINIAQDISDIKMAQDMLMRSHDALDIQVRERTAELSEANTLLEEEISERNRAEQYLVEYSDRLERSNESLQEFAYVASHDLQEPLRKILAFGDRVQSIAADSLNEQAADYLARMRNAAKRMQNLINGLLEFSRISTKAQAFVSIDLNKAAEAVVSDLEIRIEQTGGKIEVADLATIEGDPLQIQQVMQNLIGNALKFRKDDVPPVVKVHGELIKGNGESDSSVDDRDYYRIVVEDNGIGFDKKYTERIFGVFQRLHGKNKYEGTGIGLSICRKIADRHQGNIEAMSTPGEGSRFTLTVPVKHDESSIG